LAAPSTLKPEAQDPNGNVPRVLLCSRATKERGQKQHEEKKEAYLCNGGRCSLNDIEAQDTGYN